jgi:hypothetical protein
MFESPNSPEPARIDHSSPREGHARLRPIEWGELSARLEAVRDCRRVLRAECNRNIARGGAFADAAARFCRDRDMGQPDVNSVGLGASKEWSAMHEKSEILESDRSETHLNAATGDARES